jgi:hypothetical protein
MRPIDADALKDNMFHYAAPEMLWDRGDIEHKINEMPTIDAIPVEWIMKWSNKRYRETRRDVSIVDVLEAWQKEQEVTQ